MTGIRFMKIQRGDRIMKKYRNRTAALALAGLMALFLAACGSSEKNTPEETHETEAEGGSGDEKIVNIGVTDSLGGINPLTTDQTWINKYAVGLQFLPLMDLDGELSFQPMLADSITTEDNRNFVVHIDENATWSDGMPVTAEDVEFTFLRLASPVIANPTMVLYAFEGVGEDGFVEEGATSVDGVRVLDEKTIQFTTKYPMSLTTFQNSYACYLHTLPKHVIEKFDESQIATQEWFSHPDVVDGPYRVVDLDANHYVSYVANENYWRGAPKIDRLNFKIVDSSQILSGLQSGEIDVTHHTMTAIPQEDYESIEALENVEVVYGSPITHQSVFIQTANLPDVRVRQALLCAIDRKQILEQLLRNHGEVVDGFLSSASPLYDASIQPVVYDPERAKALLEEAGWDNSQTLVFYVNSGDGTLVNAAQVMVAQWAAVGIKVEVRTVDLAALMGVAGSTDYDLMAVQYTYAPVDPYPDIAWLLGGEGSWTGYGNDQVNEALEGTQAAENVEEIRALYSIVDRQVQEDVPMFSAYVISAQGAVNKRLSGVNANVYGFFNNIQEWDVEAGK